VGTFLEYVAERLMGPPLSQSGGRSTWPCPFHSPDDHPSFCTLPPKAGCKDRYRCFSCGVWGDEYDLVKNFFDCENFGERRKRLAKWREDFKRDVPAGDSPVIPSGDRGATRQSTVARDDQRDVEAAFADLPPAEICVMAAAARIDRRLKLTPSPLANYCLSFETWSTEMAIIGRMMAEEEAEEQARTERVQRSMRKGPVVNAKTRTKGREPSTPSLGRGLPGTRRNEPKGTKTGG
jgi:hypothetical protein